MASRACLACTLLNAPSQTVCSLCGTPLPLQNCEDKDASDEKVEADRSSGGSDGYYSKNRKILGRNPQAFQISFEYYKVLKRDPAATGIMPIMGLVKLPHLGSPVAQTVALICCITLGYIIRTMIRTIAKMETGIFGHEGVECVHEAGGGMKEEESGCAFGKLAPRFVQISFRDNCPGGHSFFSVARLKNRAVLSYHLVLDPASHSSHGTILSKLKSASSVEDIIVAERYCDSNNTVGKSSRSNSAEMNLSSEPMKERIVQNNESKLVTPAQIMSSFCLMSKSIMETVNSLRRYERDEYKNSFGTQRPA
eukprot:jgi/Bigna1/132671/aug1.18_g7379